MVEVLLGGIAVLAVAIAVRYLLRAPERVTVAVEGTVVEAAPPTPPATTVTESAPLPADGPAPTSPRRRPAAKKAAGKPSKARSPKAPTPKAPRKPAAKRGRKPKEAPHG